MGKDKRLNCSFTIPSILPWLNDLHIYRFGFQGRPQLFRAIPQMALLWCKSRTPIIMTTSQGDNEQGLLLDCSDAICRSEIHFKLDGWQFPLNVLYLVSDVSRYLHVCLHFVNVTCLYYIQHKIYVKAILNINAIKYKHQYAILVNKRYKCRCIR